MRKLIRFQYRGRAAASRGIHFFRPVTPAGAGEPLVLRASVAGAPQQVAVFVSRSGSDFVPVPMRQAGPGRYEAEVPVPESDKALKYFIEATDTSGNRAVHPAEVRRKPLPVDISNDHAAPEVQIETPQQAMPGRDFQVTARVTGASGIQSVRLRYRRLTQFEDYRSVEMTRRRNGGTCQARIPGDFIVPQWDLIYFIEAIDKHGNGRIYPDLDVEAPYVVVSVRR